MIDVIRPIHFQDTLRLVFGDIDPVVRDPGAHQRFRGGLIETEAFWININGDTR